MSTTLDCRGVKNRIANMFQHGSGIRVLLVDDAPLIISSFQTYLATTNDIEVVATAQNGKEALAVLETVDVDLVLADIHMPEMDGVTLLREIKFREKQPIFVAITALDSDRTMLKVLAMGGAGYIVKSATPQSIINAIRDAVAGGTTVSPKAMRRLTDYIPSEVPIPSVKEAELERISQSLTKIEKRVLQHLCEGLSNVEIATAMNYSEGTIKRHLSNLISYFAVSSRLKLAITVVESGLQRYL